MTEDAVIELAKQAGFLPDVGIPVHPSNLFKFAALVAAAEREEVLRLHRENQFIKDDLLDCAKLCEGIAAAEREKVAKWMIARSYATGHGDTIEDLLNELDWQIKERIAAEREECAKVCEQIDTAAIGGNRPAPNDCAAAIRNRQ